MSADFRDFLQSLRAHDELLEIKKAIDLRNVAALVPQSDKALIFTSVQGYSMPVVSGLLNSRNRMSLGMGVPYAKIEEKLRSAMAHPIPPGLVERAPVKEVVHTGEEVDLFNLPIPIFSLLDGGPMITGGVIIAEDGDYGLNAGMYRLMLKEKNKTGIDIVTPNNLRKFAERALQSKKPLPISVAIGVHPYEMVASTFKAALGTNELTYAGGLRGEPLELACGETVPVPCIADAEIVLEGEIIPEGWTQPEGPFCEFNRLMGGVHYNPRVRFTAIMHRRDAIFYALHMPWEKIWMSAPIYEAAAWRVLQEAGVTATAINVTPGGCCHWHIIAAIRKQPGDGKNAILALLSIADIKHVVVTDDDIDIFDPVDVEWAIATRVQADRDVMIVSNARSKPLDPSLPPGAGIPTTAKMGIDATVPENVPRERYQRIVYMNEGRAQLKDYLGEPGIARPRAAQSFDGETLENLAKDIFQAVRTAPMHFAELLERFSDESCPRIARAVGLLYQEQRIIQDKAGKLTPREGTAQGQV
ncbi:MAG: UbiD family decarboxylase [Deltaproteobacteria bacterium]|nr:UbiD family decarboxylase [Deltaproteobacteria bacterium]